MEMKKILALFVIFLFIGVAVAPSINLNVVKASNDNDLVEVTTQACGIKGYRNTTVKLTREQYQNLEQYLVEFRARLNQTSTREEAVPIFKEAVVELDKYGLLPRGMNVERVQRLVIGPYFNDKLIRYLETLPNEPKKCLDNFENKFCLISGEAQSYTIFQGLASRVSCNILYIIAILFERFQENFIIPLLLISIITIFLSNKILTRPYIGAQIYYGNIYGDDSGTEYYPAEGSIWTDGTYGNKVINGPFYGRLNEKFPSLILPFDQYCLGVKGFMGLKLFYNSTVNYFGFALNVNVSSNPY